MLGYSLEVLLDFNFHTCIENILALPYYDWTAKILGKSARYSIDLYKEHILNQSIYSDYLEEIDLYNYYKVLCLSESVLFDSLMQEKYRINKGD